MCEGPCTVNISGHCFLSHCNGRAAFSTFSLWLPFWNTLAFLPKNPLSFLVPSDPDEAQMFLKFSQNSGQQV